MSIRKADRRPAASYDRHTQNSSPTVLIAPGAAALRVVITTVAVAVCETSAACRRVVTPPSLLAVRRVGHQRHHYSRH